MKRFLASLVLGLAAALPVQAAEGLVEVRSDHDVPTTEKRLVAALEANGLKVFARIDHAEGAAGVGKELPPTRLVIFGNPKVGTPLMQCARTAAIDLPQKALIWRDDDGRVWFAYNDPQYLADRHGTSECGGVVRKVERVLGKLAAAATGAE